MRFGGVFGNMQGRADCRRIVSFRNELQHVLLACRNPVFSGEAGKAFPPVLAWERRIVTFCGLRIVENGRKDVGKRQGVLDARADIAERGGEKEAPQNDVERPRKILHEYGGAHERGEHRQVGNDDDEFPI